MNNKPNENMLSPLTKTIYCFTVENAKKVNALTVDAQVLSQSDFYKYVDCLYQIYGERL